MASSYRQTRLQPQQTMHSQVAVVKRTRSDENVRPQNQPEQKRLKYKTVFQEVTTKRKPLDLRLDSDVPLDYKLVRYGRKEVTEFLLNSSRKHGLPVWTARSNIDSKKSMVNRHMHDPQQSAYHVSRVGYYFQEELVANAEKWFEIKINQGHVKDDGNARQSRPTVAELMTALAEIYPQIPDRDKDAVRRRLDPKTGSSIREGNMNAYMKIELTVISHVRHSYTDYDKMLKQGMSHDEARKQVQPDITKKLIEWKGEDAKDEYETAFQEVIDLVAEPERYSPPGSDAVWQVRRRSTDDGSEPSRPSSRHPDVERLNPPWNMPEPTAQDRQHWAASYQYIEPAKPVMIGPHKPHLEISAPAMLHTGSGGPHQPQLGMSTPAVKLIPLPPRPQPGPPLAPPQNSLRGYQAAPPPPIQYSPAPIHYNPTHHQYTPPAPLPRPPYNFEPLTMSTGQSNVYLRPIPPEAPSPPSWHARSARANNLPELPPGMRYRPVHADDVVPSREAHSPPHHILNGGRNDQWGDYISPHLEY